MKKHRPPVSVLNICLGASIMTGAAYAVDSPVTLVSFMPDHNVVARNMQADEDLADFEARIEAERADAIRYAEIPLSEADAAKLAGEPELLVFTCRKPGECAACDRVRAQWEELQDVYPITPVYCSLSSTPKTRGDVVALKYDVEAYPTFVLVVRNADGTADELDRWRGAGSFWESTEKHIRRAFDEAGYQPRVTREGVKPPPREPRPIPGLNPPGRKEPARKPKPSRVVPPGTRPGLPKASFGFSVDFGAFDLED